MDRPHSVIIKAIQADITTLDVDAIVNAANPGLIPGSGVDGAIRRAAGPALTEATAQIGGCPTGEAVITPGFRLKARWVIHTAAPVFAAHPESEVRRLLAACYASCLALAARHGISHVAFPALGTGIYGIPLALAIPVAADTVRRAPFSTVRQVTFCCFSEGDLLGYRAYLDAAPGGASGF